MNVNCLKLRSWRTIGKQSEFFMNLERKFFEIFKREPEIRARAPGRVNLIGEHTDYNDGFVMPIAIRYEIVVLACPRRDRLVHLHSVGFGQSSSFSLDQPIERDTVHPWSNYERGVFSEYLKRGIVPGGADMLIYGNVPVGAGLSSSAAVEMATSQAVKGLNSLDLSGIDMIKLSQDAENKFVGMNCGIMDQFISCMGEEGKALFLDCRSLEYDLIPFPNDAYTVVIMNTKVKRELTGTEYNERRGQCEEGVRLLGRKIRGIKALRDVEINDFNRNKTVLPKKVRMRCEHVIKENARVKAFVGALKDRDSERMGLLLADSHKSLRDLYEVSCRELDSLVDIASAVKGVVGARMTGAGFGGCAIAIVEKGREKDLEEAVLKYYPERTGIEPEIYISEPSQGAGVEKLK